MFKGLNSDSITLNLSSLSTNFLRMESSILILMSKAMDRQAQLFERQQEQQRLEQRKREEQQFLEQKKERERQALDYNRRCSNLRDQYLRQTQLQQKAIVEFKQEISRMSQNVEFSCDARTELKNLSQSLSVVFSIRFNH